MPKVTDEYRDARRDQILSAARRCFLRDGFHATSMQDLFAEAGLSSGAVYSYFASKDDVIAAIAEENMREVVAMIHDVASSQPDRAVGMILADIFKMVDAKDAREGLAGLAVLTWSEALRNPALANRFADLFAQMRADLAEVVRNHQGAGSLPPQVPAESLAAVLISVVPGYILQLATLRSAAVEGVPAAAEALLP
ncbi:MAG TPA: TetR/AcrR family transcriptional regulator [Streptosporangiaceae bacterium]|nr:TetR/AcrR family transcriptional regulator [Streptosporangiaceae bacterium]